MKMLLISILFTSISCGQNHSGLIAKPEDYKIHLILDNVQLMKLPKELGGDRYYGDLGVDVKLSENKVEFVRIERILLRDKITETVVLEYFSSEVALEPLFISAFNKYVELHLSNFKPRRLEGAPKRSEFVSQIVSFSINRD